MKKKEKIKKLIDEHLIGWYQPDEDSFKAHYKITVENLIWFLDTYFKVKDKFKKV
jgi:hypothetical protein